MGRWIAIVLGLISLPVLCWHVRFALETQRDKQFRVSLAVGKWEGLVERINKEVPAGAPLLVDTWQRPRTPADQFNERELAYWVFPRRVYSAAAQRKSGTPLSTLVKRHKIAWGVHGAKLVELDPRTVDQRFSGDEFEEKLPGATSLVVPVPVEQPDFYRWSWVLLGLVMYVAAGFGTLHLLGVARQVSNWWERLALSWLVGLAVLSLLGLSVFLSGESVRFLRTLVWAMVITVGGAVAAWRRRSDETHPPPSVSVGRPLVVRLGLGLVITCLLLAAWSGPDGFDQRMQWAYKARLVLVEPGPFGDSVFQDDDHVHFHPRYPLLVPVAAATLGSAGGAFNESAYLVLFPLTFAAAAVMLAGGLRRQGLARTDLGGLILLLVPAWCGLFHDRDNLACFGGCPELVLGVGLLGSVVCALEAWRSGRMGWFVVTAVLALMAGLAKAEGFVHVLVAVLLAWLLAWRARRGPRRAVLVTGVVILVTLLVHEVVFTHRVSVGILQDDYRRLLTPAGVINGLGRMPQVALRLGWQAFLSPRFAALGLLIIVAAWKSGARWRRPETSWPLAICGLMLAGYCLPFLVVPDWEDNLDWASGRLVAELTPLAVWCLAVLVLPRLESEEPLG